MPDYPAAPLIQIKDLSHSYQIANQSNQVLHRISLDIAAGERLALLGRSGSGKSTLLNLISGIDQVAEGSISFDGLKLTDLSEHERTLFRRRHIGFVYQSFNLIQTLTVAENVAMVLELNGMSRGDVVDLTQAMLEAVDLAALGGRFPDQLSGGEQQRVAIARALVHTPSLLLADELTGNLDAATGTHILELLDKLLADHPVTLIMVTHSLVVARTTDRIVTLEDGCLQEREEGFAW